MVEGLEVLVGENVVDKRLLLFGVCMIMALSFVDLIGGSGASFVGATWNGSYIGNKTTINDGGQTMMLEPDILMIASVSDDSLRIYNVSNFSRWISIQNYSDSSSAGSIDGVYGFDKIGNIIVAIGQIDSNIQVLTYDSSAKTISAVNNLAVTAPPGSAEGAYSIVLENRSGMVKAHIGGRTDDDYSIYNITTTSNPVRVSNWTATANPCSVDNVYSLAIDPLRHLTYVCANSDDTISIINHSVETSLSCVYNWTDIDTPYSVDGCMMIKLPSEFNYQVLFVGGRDDSDISIYNVSDPSNPVGIGNFRDVTPPCSVETSRGFGITDGGRTLFVTPSGNNNEQGVTVLNITDLTNPSCIGWINATTDTGFYMNYTYWITFDNRTNNRYTYITGVNTDVVSVINETYPLYPPEVPPVTDTCSCPASPGNWAINMPDHCNITSACNIAGYNITFTNGTSSDYANISSTVTLHMPIINCSGWVIIDSDGWLNLTI